MFLSLLLQSCALTSCVRTVFIISYQAMLTMGLAADWLQISHGCHGSGTVVPAGNAVSGCPLAFQILDAACAIMGDMATFEQAGIDDGYMNVTDAVKSYRSLERRREILKDSHVGAFAVIGIVLLLLAQFAFMASAKENADLRILIFVPAVSRCCSALAVTALKPMHTSQYADQKKPKSHIVMLMTMTAAFVAAGFLLCGHYGFALVGCLAGYGVALRKANKSLEGMNGDISGYALSIAELCAVSAYALI